MNKLLNILEENGRAEPEELAKSLDMTVDEVKAKIQEFEENGIIQGYKAVINRQKMSKKDVPVTALIEVNISPQTDTGFESIAQKICDHVEVESCYLCSGDYDLLVRVKENDLQDIAEFVATELAPQNYIKGTVSHFLLKTYKENGLKFDDAAPDHRMSISM